MDNTSITWVNIDGLQVPLKIYRERRRSMRISIGADKVHLRIPRGAFTPPAGNAVQWAKEWLTKKYLKHPELFERFRIKTYDDGQKISTTLKEYTLKLEYKDRKTFGAKLHRDKYIILSLPYNTTTAQMANTVASLISRTVAGDQYHWVEARLLQLKSQYFADVKMNDLRLKYNKSNWGSCSTKGNINLSSRLLLAPIEVMDYVIIHELTHLIHPNHSRAFWHKVAEVMPDYKQKERWLSENNHLCVF